MAMYTSEIDFYFEDFVALTARKFIRINVRVSRDGRLKLTISLLGTKSSALVVQTELPLRRRGVTGLLRFRFCETRTCFHCRRILQRTAKVFE